LDALQKEIMEEARRKANAIESRSAKEAGATVKEAQARADAAEEAFERELSGELHRITLEYKSAREMQERNILASAREQLADGLVDRVKAAAIRRIREKGYKRLFDSAIAEALKISPMEGLTLVMDKRDEKFAKGFTGRIRHAKMDGLVIYAADGRIKIDATLEAIFERKRDAVKQALVASVFGAAKRAAKGPRRAKAARSVKRRK
jgi:vacuolar-type H+-ATPase subunit E/Vma4